MRTFAEKPKTTQSTASAQASSISRAHVGRGYDPNSINYLQRTIGNQAVNRLLQTNAAELEDGLTSTTSPRFGHDFSRIPVTPPKAGAIQTKLAINKPGYEYEREADRVAEPVTQVHTPQQVLRSSGQPLNQSIRPFMESRFGHDLSHVRVHTNDAAAASARALNARAYTFGHHIVFGVGELRPETAAGSRLLAHELAHVLQQRPITAVPDGRFEFTRPRDPLERQADWLANRALLGQSPAPVPSAIGARIARQEVDIDIEVPPPAEREALRQRGVELPQVSPASADPRRHSDYVDRKVTAVGFGIYLGGYLVYCDDLPLPVFVPESDIDFRLTNVAAPDPSIYPDRGTALNAVPYGPPAAGQPERTTTFYRGAGGALIAPTIFSPATTPRFIETALRARRELAEQVQHDLAVLAMSLVGGMALRAILNRIARIGTRGTEPPRPTVPPGTGAALGRQMAQEMRAAGFRGNPFREFMRRLNARPQRLPPQEAAEAIEVATREFSGGTMGTMPPLQHGNVLVVPSRAPIPNAPVMGIRGDGTVIMGRAPRIELVRNAQGGLVYPPQARIIGEIVWE